MPGPSPMGPSYRPNLSDIYAKEFGAGGTFPKEVKTLSKILKNTYTNALANMKPKAAVNMDIGKSSDNGFDIYLSAYQNGKSMLDKLNLKNLLPAKDLEYYKNWNITIAEYTDERAVIRMTPKQ